MSRFWQGPPLATVKLRMVASTVPVMGARRWVSAADAAVSARRALEEGDEDWAFRLIVQARDHLRRLDPVDVALWAEEPPSTGDRRFDLLLAAVAARTLRELGAAVPGWASGVEPLDEPWYPARLPSLRARADREAPEDLRELGIMLTESDLTTA